MIAQNIKSNSKDLETLFRVVQLLICMLVSYGCLYYIRIFVAPIYPSWAVSLLRYPLIIIIIGVPIVLALGLTLFVILKLFFKR